MSHDAPVLGPKVWGSEAQAQGAFLGEPELDLLGVPDGAKPRPALNGIKIERAPPTVLALLRALCAGLTEAAEESGPSRRYEVEELSAPERAELFDILGQGEAYAAIGGEPEFQIQETVLPGLWRIRSERSGIAREWLEIADVPDAVRRAAAHHTFQILHVPGESPEGTMNAPAILFEIAAKMAAVAPGAPNEVINFTLLPLTQADAAWIARVLGVGPINAISSGFGDCRITSTAFRNVWAVQYLNAMGTVILDTIEIGDVPKAFCAAREDFEDSAARLHEIIGAYAS
jgi:hydrogenase-1 operon protein HyaF